MPLSDTQHAKRQRVETKAFNLLRAQFPDEYNKIFSKIKQYYPDLSFKQKKQKAITALKSRHRKEWRIAINEVAKEVGFNTAEMRREKAVSKLMAEVYRLQQEPMKVTKAY